MSADTAPDISSSSSSISERRLAANRANAQLSTGPTTPQGKAKSSLNAVKTGLTGRTILFADEEDAEQYRAHVARYYEEYEPVGQRETTLVQSLADTQWRLNNVPALESGLFALSRLRGVELLSHADPQVQKILLDAQALVAEARQLKNLYLQESRLRRQYGRDADELADLQNRRWWNENRRKQQEAERREQEEQQQEQ